MTEFARSRGRPLGEVSQALLQAVRSGGPAPVRVLAERACIGYDVARVKAGAMVRSGALVPLNEGRPMVLGLPPAGPTCDGLGALALGVRAWWRGPRLVTVYEEIDAMT